MSKASKPDFKNSPFQQLMDQRLSPIAQAQSHPAQMVAIAAIEVGPQPRSYFDPQRLQALMDSIQQHGLLQPVVLRPMGGQLGRYQLIAGERRLRACVALQHQHILAHILEVDEHTAQELMLVENLQREDLDPISEVSHTWALLQLRSQLDSETLRSVLVRAFKAGVTPAATLPDAFPSEDEARQQYIVTLLQVLGCSVSTFYTHRLPLLTWPTVLIEAVQQGLPYSKAKLVLRYCKTERHLYASALAAAATMTSRELELWLKAQAQGQVQGQLTPRNLAAPHQKWLQPLKRQADSLSSEQQAMFLVKQASLEAQLYAMHKQYQEVSQQAQQELTTLLAKLTDTSTEQ